MNEKLLWLAHSVAEPNAPPSSLATTLGGSCNQRNDLPALHRRSADTLRLARQISRTFQELANCTHRHSNGNRAFRFHAYFAMLYARTVEGWHGYAAESSNPEFYYRLTVEFFDLYLVNVIDPLERNAVRSPSPYWNSYFEAVERGQPGSLDSILHTLLMGVRAHVLGDLPKASLHAVAASGLCMRDPAIRRQFQRPPGGYRVFMNALNRFLNDVDTYHRRLSRPGECSAPFPKSKLLATLFVLLMQYWRQLAWRRAARIADASA